MCEKNCKCGNGNGEVAIEAVGRKLEGIVDNSIAKIKTIIQLKQVDTKGGISAINKELFDGISKEDLVSAIVKDDRLSFEGLLSRDDVKTAIEATNAVYAKANETMNNFGKKFHTTLKTFDAEYQRIMDDVVIFGITDDIRAKIEEFEVAVNIAVKNFA